MVERTIFMPPRQYAAMIAFREREALKRGDPTFLLSLIARRAERAMFEFSRRSHVAHFSAGSS